MRKQLCAAILASFLLLAGCAGGNTADQADTTPMSEEEIAQMYSDPEQFVGRSLELFGQVFTSPEYDDTAVYFQMWADPTNGDWNTVVAYNDSSFQLEADDYVRVSGVVQDVYEGENMMGGTIVAPMITANSVEVISYKEAVAPTLYEATIDQPAQTQLGYSVELQAVELAEKETRVYVSVTNQGSASFSLYTFDAKIVQNGKQYEESDNWDANYPEIQTDLLVGSSTEGVIVFPAIEQADFDVILEASSDNWDENIQPYTFHCTFSTGSAGTASSNATSETVVNTINYLLYSNATTQSAGLVLSGSSLGSAYLWPTDTQTITDNDLQKLTQTEVSAVRNEIYARHGYPFTSAEWSAFFDTASWYQANDAYSNDMLNQTERANIDTILRYEENAGWRQPQQSPEQLASQAALDYCNATGWTNSSVNFVESRPAGGYYVNVMKADASGNSYEENFVVTVSGNTATVIGTEQFGEFTPIS